MNRADGVVEFTQQRAGIIPRSVHKDIHFRVPQYSKAYQLAVEPVDMPDLLPQILLGNPACYFQALRVVADSNIFVVSGDAEPGHAGVCRTAGLDDWETELSQSGFAMGLFAKGWRDENAALNSSTSLVIPHDQAVATTCQTRPRGTVALRSDNTPAMVDLFHVQLHV